MCYKEVRTVYLKTSRFHGLSAFMHQLSFLHCASGIEQNFAILNSKRSPILPFHHSGLGAPCKKPNPMGNYVNAGEASSPNGIIQGRKRFRDHASAEDVILSLSNEELFALVDSSHATEPYSLSQILKEAAEVLCFEFVSDVDTKSVILQETGKFDWWNRLNAKVIVGYDKVGQLETEPRFRRRHLQCKSLSGLRNALRDLRDARVNATFVRKRTKQAARDVSTWEVASAIAITQTVMCNLRVSGRYIRWCEQDMKISHGFKMDVPACIKIGSAVDVQRSCFMIQVDEGTMISLRNVGQIPQLYDGRQLLCAKSDVLELTKDGMIDEIKSKWDVLVIGAQTSYQPTDQSAHKFFPSSVTVYLS